MPKILNRPQAEAIHSALCALGNVAGRLEVQMEGIRVSEKETGRIFVFGADRYPGPALCERYLSHVAFAEAYGLDGGSPRAPDRPVAHMPSTTQEQIEDDAIERFNIAMSCANGARARNRERDRLAKALNNPVRAAEIYDAWNEQAAQAARESRQ